MKVHELIHLLTDMDEDADITFLGHQYNGCNDWECWYSPKVKFCEDDYSNEVLMEGDLDI